MILLYKSWLEMRVRLAFGLGAISALCLVTIWDYQKLTHNVARDKMMLMLLPFTQQAIDSVTANYSSFIWAHWNAFNQLLLLPMLAMTIASAGILPNGACLRERGDQNSAAAAFMLSLPVRRHTLLLYRGAIGLLALAIFAFVPQLMIVALSPLVSAAYSFQDALAYGAISFAAMLIPYALGLVVSSLIDDDMTSRLSSIFFLIALLILERTINPSQPFAYYRFLSGEAYFTTHEILWIGMAACTLLAAAITWAAIQIVERRDY